MTSDDAHPFLSDEWIDAARAIRAKYAHEAPEIAADLRMNIVVFDVPFRDGELRAFLDTSAGATQLELGEIENADVTVTTDYVTAQAIFVDQNPEMAMQSFMAGKVKVQGDMMKLMVLQTTINPDDELGHAAADEIAAITERPASFDDA